MASVYTSLWMNEIKYVWINEVDYEFDKEASLVQVSYVQPSFWEVLMSSPLFQGLMAYERMIWKMLRAICNMLYVICKMLCVVCNIISMMMHVTLMEWLS